VPHLIPGEPQIENGVNHEPLFGETLLTPAKPLFIFFVFHSRRNPSGFFNGLLGKTIINRHQWCWYRLPIRLWLEIYLVFSFHNTPTANIPRPIIQSVSPSSVTKAPPLLRSRDGFRA
jgi:hypothetical protein